MLITDKFRKELVGKKLICQSNTNPSLTEGQSYMVIKAEETNINELQTLVTILSDMKDERTYDLAWFMNADEQIIYDNKNTYYDLYFSPVSYIRLDGIDEEHFTKKLKDNKPIIFTSEQRSFTYDKIPETIKWLQDVYDLATKLKNKVEYVDWETAKEYMNNGNKAMFENETYYIKNGELYCEELNSAVALKLRAIESDKWILIKN